MTARSSRRSSPSGRSRHGVRAAVLRSPTRARTTQAQNVVNGSGADVVALSLAPDVDTIADAGLITHDWTHRSRQAAWCRRSVVVFDVRPGNPKGIEDWNDLAHAGRRGADAGPGSERRRPVEPRRPRGAPPLRGDVPAIPKDDEAGATTLMQRLRGNVLAVRQERPRLDPELRGRATATSPSRTRTRSRRRTRPAASRTRRSTRRRLDPDREPGRGRRRERRRRTASRTWRTRSWSSSTRRKPRSSTRPTGYLRSTDPTKAQAGDPANGFPAIQDLFTVEDLGGWDALDTTRCSATDGIATQAKANAG